MNEDFDREKVLARVKKMMTLANDAAASEGERDNALRMAHATLAKYNLTMAEAERTGTAKEEARKEEAFVGRTYPWMRTTAHAAATLFFCNYFFVSFNDGSRRKVKHYFIGKESNAATAKAMAEYLIDSINREAKRYGGGKGTHWRSFCKGAAYAVYKRCKEIQDNATRPTKTPGTALVLANFYEAERKANDCYIRDKMGVRLTTSSSRERNTAASAFHAGERYGNSVSLNNQIGGGTGGSGSKRLK